MNPIYPNEQGMIVLYDGSEIFVVDVEYSNNGKTHWEKNAYDIDHYYEEDNTVLLGKTNYIRFKKAGTLLWDNPIKYRGEDGEDAEEVELRVTSDRLFQTKKESETEWETLLDLEDLRGEQGPMGRGWHVADGGALDVRPDCCGGSTPVPTCNTCNPLAANVCGISTYISIGNHRISSIDILDEATYWHSLDGVTWIQTTEANLGEYVTAWMATSGTGTDAYSCNLQGQVVAFSSLVTPYISKGMVYACADGVWTEFINVITPTGLIKVSNEDGLQFLEAKLDDVTLEAYDSGNGFNDKIRIKDDGVNEFKIISSAIGDGLDGGSGDTIVADPTDFAGFGLKEYTSDADGLDDVQVDVPVLCGDAIEPQDDSLNEVDGEDRQLFKVKPSDLINSPNATNTEYTGLATSTQLGFTEEDGFDNLFVKEGDCIENDADGVNVRADELTIAALDETEARVWETDSNTLGIQAKHIHKNAADENQGLKKINDTTGAFKVKEDTLRGSIGFNGSGEVHVPDNGIQGVHLNDNTCDNDRGAEILNDKIVVKVDSTSIEFNGSGQLQVIEAYIQSLIDAGVASLVAPGETSMTGDIIFNAANLNGLISISVAGAGAVDGVITYTSDVDESSLTTFITNVIDSIVTDETTYERLKNILVQGSGIDLTFNDTTSKVTIASTISTPTAGNVQTLDGNKSDGTSSAYAREDHKHDVADGALTIPKTAGLQSALDSKLGLNTEYGSIRITNSGLEIQSPGGRWFLLQVDENGGLDTRKI